MFTIIIIKILKIFIIGGYMISFFSVSFAKSGTDNLKPNQILVLPMNINQIAQMETTSSKDGILIFLNSFE